MRVKEVKIRYLSKEEFKHLINDLFCLKLGQEGASQGNMGTIQQSLQKKLKITYNFKYFVLKLSWRGSWDSEDGLPSRKWKNLKEGDSQEIARGNFIFNFKWSLSLWIPKSKDEFKSDIVIIPGNHEKLPKRNELEWQSEINWAKKSFGRNRLICSYKNKFFKT